MKEFSGLLGIRYVKTAGDACVMAGSTEIKIDDQFSVALKRSVVEKIRDGGDDNVQLVYFPSLDCPECQRFGMLVKAYRAANPAVGTGEVEDEVLLQRFYGVYNVPEEKRQKPVIFIGSRYLIKNDISSNSLILEGKIPWLDIYGLK
jgi:hypothetical protein